MTEVYDYLRLLFARVGHPYCPNCHIPIQSQTVEQMVDRVMKLPERTRLQVLAPVVRGRKGEHQKVFEQMRKWLCSRACRRRHSRTGRRYSAGKEP
ncbi:hypothetical protein GCM10025858_23540 [Alicyclobacillus sacchari]|nr:hypothetical protein GCM10025858_23540 [Alicyclobacillus sacchari]